MRIMIRYKQFFILFILSLWTVKPINIIDICYNDVEHIEINDWELVSDEVEATVYNATSEQCNEDYCFTASMFKLNLNDVLSHRIIAMERTFMKELGLKYGDIVKIEGADNLDGVWQIQDTMNKRFAGKKKIDFLVPENIKHGKWNNIKLYTLSNDEKKEEYKNNMAPQAVIKKV